MELDYHRETLYKFIKYCLVGICNTLCTIFIMAFLAYLGFHYVTYTAAAYIITFFLSFTLNFYFTFASKNNFLLRLFRFLFINICNLILVELLQIFLIEFFRMPHLFAILAGMCFYSTVGFFMNRAFVYKAEQGS